MTLRVAHLVAVLALLSLGDRPVSVGATVCTEDEEARLGSDFDGIHDGLSSTCSGDVCAFECQDQLDSSMSALPDCYATDGINYRQGLLDEFACEETEEPATDETKMPETEEPASTEDSSVDTDGFCSSEVETSAQELIDEFPDVTDCTSTPCESNCYDLLQHLADSLPVCKFSDGNDYGDIYLSAISSCSETSAPTSAPNESTTAPIPASTETNGTSGTSGAPSTQRPTRTSSTGSDSASGSQSSSEGNGAVAAASGSVVGSLVVAGAALALLTTEH